MTRDEHPRTRRRSSFTQAEIARACRAAPDRIIEIKYPDGTVIRIKPAGEMPDKPEVKLRDFTL